MSILYRHFSFLLLMWLSLYYLLHNKMVTDNVLISHVSAPDEEEGCVGPARLVGNKDSHVVPPQWLGGKLICNQTKIAM